MNSQRNDTETGEEILVVEDSPTQAARLHHVMEEHGYRLASARNGREAIEALSKRPPALVISDVVMPEMDGYQLCHHIKQDENLRKIPVILLTSLNDPIDVVRGLECGADNFLFKPYEDRYLLARVAYILANRHLRESESTQMGVEILFGGRRFFITSDRLQILNLLLSTYEAAVQRNRELASARDELRDLNETLETKVHQRTLALESEIMERRRAEAEVRRLNAELEQRVLERTAQLERANVELEAFSYSVSHDLRAPLRHIDGFLGLLKNHAGDGLDEKSHHYLKTISESAKQMGRLIDDLLAFSQMARAEMLHCKIDLQLLVQETLRDLQHETHGRDIQWKIHPLPEVRGDPSMIRQVLGNLVANAVKYSRTRVVANIEIGAQDSPAEHVLFVRDNGVGFDMQFADKLFGVFQRLHREEEFEGTGIGLANVRRVIARHGGRTWAEAKLGSGAPFYFTLPKSHPQGQ